METKPNFSRSQFNFLSEPRASTDIYVKSPTVTGFILTLMVTLVICSPALAQSDDPARAQGDPAPLVLSDGREYYPLGHYLEILEDPTGELTIDDVTSPEFDAQFIPSLVEVPVYGYTDSAIWVRLPLRNESSLSDHWLLELAFASMNFVDLYTPLPDGGGFAVKQTGNLRPPATRDYPDPHIVFDLSIPTQSEQVVYLRFQNGSSMSLPLALWKPTVFLTQSAQNQALHGIYFGILIGLLGYNLFLLLSLREPSHLYLVILLATMIVFEAAYLGYMEIYLAPALYYLRPYLFTTLVLTDLCVDGLIRRFFSGAEDSASESPLAELRHSRRLGNTDPPDTVYQLSFSSPV